MRLQSLRSLNILDTQPDERYNCITRYLSYALRVPIVGIALVDSNRIWFKSVVGGKSAQAQRGTSICAHAIVEVESRNLKGRVYNVVDLHADDRFFDASYVTKKPWLRTYTAFIIQSEFGENIGAVYAADSQLREFTDEDNSTLITAGVMIENLMLGHYFSKGIEDQIT